MTDLIRVEIERIYLDRDNPRHDPVDNEREAIDYLCKDEQVIELARDISAHGLNPLELFGFYKTNPSDTSRAYVYTAAEGNRRLCAIKLLHDPDLAPPNIREEIERLSKNWPNITHVDGVVFDSREAAKIWLDRIHGGQQNGIGRRPWNAEQKERFSGGTRNKIALEILDYAEKKGIITAEDRRKRLTTAQRFLSNVLFRDALGVKIDKNNNVKRNRNENEFRLLVKKFIADLIDGKVVNSRALKDDIDKYARSFIQTSGVSIDRTDPKPLDGIDDLTSMPPPAPKDTKPSTPIKPPNPKTVPYDDDIAQKLSELGNHKLISLYYSICKISLTDHTPVVAIAIWAFIESLTAMAGRDERTAFDAFLSTQRMSEYGLGDKNKTKQLTQVIRRISENGNATKHHMVSAEYNDRQLINDMTTLKPVLVVCMNAAIKLHSPTT